jgi:hypothetical protein
LILLLLKDVVAPGRSAYGPVDAAAIERYAMFKRMGFFGVDQNSTRGAVQFLRLSRAILGRPQTSLWLTPQGRFADVRERPVFRRGLGMLAARCERALFVPAALEYPFWEERLPEALAWVGEPIVVDSRDAADEARWTSVLESRLAETQTKLADASIRRDAAAFRTVLAGRSGVGGVYDVWRGLKARIQGKPFRKEHGQL